MAKQLNVDLNLRANTQQAKQSIQELQNKLSQIANMPISGPDKLRQGLQEASAAAQQLQMHITNATNVDTGRLDMSKFSQSLKKSNADLTQLTSKILSVGTTGQQAFVSLANSLAQADRHALSLGTKLGGLMTTLKNTARWQISSSILHGFMGTIQSAYGYAQDLNKSLNNIRIVTGKSTEEMAAFADQANKAAKALSTSTLNYTDAALIYYQQGIRDQKEIEQRTTTTVKLANVSRQSAEEVSSEMTAIWNNFAKGGKNLEYYADVITALGAATASSSQEIASGLQKFAAVADTVGLSYEKASAALATVVATTRQSEDVVGTALKTIFARVDSLKLGETLEDGVSLNKYAKALQTVGVSILDSNQNLKDMDTILNDLGNKWNNISEAQRVALAETVAGQRQYAQFMALMNNYDKVLQNENIAKNAEGTLQSQQDIYAESWEAASKRVKTSLQSIYHDLIDDKFFISLSNGFAQIINGLHDFIKNLGGIKPLLIGISGLVLSSISGKITPAIQSIGLNIKHMFMSSKAQAKEYSETMEQVLDKAMIQSGLNYDSLNPSMKVAVENARQLAEAKNRLMLVEKQLTPVEKQQYNTQLNLIQTQQEQVQLLADKLTKEKEEYEELTKSMSSEEAETALEKERNHILQEYINQRNAALSALQNTPDNEIDDLVKAANAYDLANEKVRAYKEETNLLAATKGNLATEIRGAYQELLEFQLAGNESQTVTANLGQYLGETAKAFFNLKNNANLGTRDQLNIEFTKLQNTLQELGVENIPEVQKALQKARAGLKDTSVDIETIRKRIGNVGTVLKKAKIEVQSTEQGMKKLANAGKNLGDGKNIDKLNQKFENQKSLTISLTNEQKKLVNALQSFNPQHIIKGTEAFAKMASIGMSVAMVINSIKSAFSTLSDKDASPLEKFSAVLMTIGMTVPAVISIIGNLSKLYQSFGASIALATQEIIRNNIFSAEHNAQLAKELGLSSFLIAVKTKKNDETIAENAAEAAGIIVKKLKLGEEAKELITEALLAKAKEKGSALTIKETIETVAETVAHGGATTGKIAHTAATIALTLAQLPLAAAILVVVGALTALAATIAAVVIVIKSLVNAYNADAIAAKKDAETARALKESYNEMKESYESLKQSIADYKDAKNGLDELSKGTQEWKDQLRKVNEEARTLIEQYPKLRQFAKYNEDGLLEISEEGLQQVQEEQAIALDTAYATSVAASARAAKSQNRSQITDFQRANHSSVLGSILKGAAAGGTTGSIPGAYVGALVGGLASGSRNEKLDAAIDSAVSQYSQNAELVGKTTEELAEIFNVSAELIPEIRRLGDNMREANEAYDASLETSARIAVENSKAIQNTAYGSDVANFLNAEYFQISEEDRAENISEAIRTGNIKNLGVAGAANKKEQLYREELLKARSRGGMFGTRMDSDSAAAFNAYAERLGLSSKTGYKVTNYKGNGEVAYEYIDESGKKVKATATAEMIAESNAEAAFEKYSEEQGKKIAKILEKLDQDTEKSLNSLQTKDTSSLTLQQSRAGLDVSNLSKADLNTLGYKANLVDMAVALKEGISIEEALQKRIAEDFDKQVKEAQDKLLETTSSKYGQGTKEIIQNILDGTTAGFEAITQETLEAYTASLGTIALAGGTAVAESFNEGISQLLTQNKDKESEIINIANAIDWSQGEDALSEFRAELHKAGIEVDITSEYWDKIVSSMENVNLSVLNNDIDKLRAKIKNIAELCKDVKFGSIISDEDYQKLISLNSELAKDFILTSGGYQYTGLTDLGSQANQYATNVFRESLELNRKGANVQASNRAIQGAFFENDATKLTGAQLGLWGSRYGQTQEQAEVLEAIGIDKDTFTSLGMQAYNGNETAIEQIRNIYSQIQELKNKDFDAENQNAADLYISSILNNASTLQELEAQSNQIINEFNKQNEDLAYDYNLYAGALINLAGSYENTTNEIKDYQEALAYGTQEEVAAAEAALKTAITIGELSATYGLEAEEVETQAKILASTYNISGESAARLAVRNQRLNKGVATLHENFKDWGKVLTTANHNSTEYAEALNNVNEAAADLTGAINAASIPLTFFDREAKNGQHHLALLQQAAAGDTKAIDLLSNELAEAQIETLNYAESVKSLVDEKTGESIIPLDEAEFEKKKDIIVQGIQSLRDKLNELADGEDVGEILGRNWVDALNEMAIATHMSVDEMNSYLNELGVEAQVDTTEVTQKRRIPKYKTITKVTATDTKDGYTYPSEMTTQTVQNGSDELEETIDVAQINVGEDINTPPKVTFHGSNGAGGISTGSITNSSSSSTAPSKTPTKQVNNEAERYYVVEKRTNSLSKAYDRLSRAKDQAFGANRLAIMDEELDILQQQLDTAKEYEAEARAYLQEDYNNLVNGKANGFEVDGTWYNTLGAASYGLGVELDDKGNIANYDELIAAAVARYNSVVATGDETAIKIAEKQLESFKDLINQYSETNEKLDDQIAATEEAQAAIYQAQFEKWQTKLELKITINANDKRRIEYELMKLGDDVYKTAEIVSLMFSPNKESQLTNAIQNLKDYRTAYADLEEQLKDGQITEEAFNEGIEQLKDGMYENLELLFDLSAQAKEYYTNTLSDLTDKVKEVTESMAHNLGVLDHLQNLLTLTGHGTDYKALGGLLEASEQISKQQYEASQAQYDYALDQQAKRKKEYDDAVRSGGAKEIEIAAENLKAANKLVEDAENEMLENAAAYAQAIKNTIANTITATYSELENEVTNGLGFDFLKEQMNLDEKIEERNYTKTNQLYETQKMSRKLQQDIDKTTNAAAKQRLASFQQEIDLMSQKNTLSKSELELAQARYDLLLAQIALEEAQNAKTTVRLQRDAEGNYGYVYTADQSKIAEAEQNVADKENALYNKAREIENSISKELIDAQEEYLAKVKAIDEDEALSTKEKTERKQKLEEQYKEYITNLTTERAGALKTLEKTSATDVNDTWTAKYKNIVDQQAAAHTKIHNKLGELNITLYGEDGKSGMFGKLQHSIDDILGPGLEKLASKTQAIKDKNDDLLKTLTGPDGLIQKNTENADAVAKGTLAFGKMWDKLMNKNTGLIPAIEELIKKMDEYIKKGNTTVTTKHKIVEERVGADGKTTSAVVVDNQTGVGSGSGSGVIGDPGYDPLDDDSKDDNTTKKTGYRLYYKTLLDYKNNTYQTLKYDSEEQAKESIKNIIATAEDSGVQQDRIVVYSIKDLANNKYIIKGHKVMRGIDVANLLTQLYNNNDKYAFKDSQVAGLDTGGYTGQWYHSSDDPMVSGKLAMLHEKELVLNQEDTKNFLASIEMVRDLARVIDLQAAAVGIRQQLEARLGFDAAQSELAQNIVIHADFPNATDHNEIMEAFETLADRAAQYANRADRIMTQAQENYNKAKLPL